MAFKSSLDIMLSWDKEEVKLALEQANKALEDEKNGITIYNNQRVVHGRYFYDTRREWLVSVYDIESIKSPSQVVTTLITLWKSVNPSFFKSHGMPHYSWVWFWVEWDAHAKSFYNRIPWEVAFNMFDPSNIAKPSENPTFPAPLERLINNLTKTEANKKWLMEAIAYKYMNLWTSLIPAVLFKGVGGTGKGMFMKLLAKIFSNDYVASGISWNILKSWFMPDMRNKFIVEFREMNVTNGKDGKETTDLIKSMINESSFTLNQKYGKMIDVSNQTWCFFSSNHSVPLVLDSWSSGNRRFTIIETCDTPLTQDEACAIIKSIENDTWDFLAYLMKEYSYVSELSWIRALENDEKKHLEDMSASEAEEFFEWFRKIRPHVTFITTKQKEYLVNVYDRTEERWIAQITKQIFNRGLPLWVKSNQKCRGERGYMIGNEAIPFSEKEWENLKAEYKDDYII